MRSRKNIARGECRFVKMRITHGQGGHTSGKVLRYVKIPPQYFTAKI